MFMWITFSTKKLYFLFIDKGYFFCDNGETKGGHEMVILSESDMFEVKVTSLLADYDRETITNLYQPIIGYTALAIYFSFWSESKNQKVLSLSSHEQFLARMKMNPGTFIEGRKLLEAVGLIKTRLEKVQEVKIYHYEVLAPKTPSGFFADTLLYGLLIQALGESEAERVKRVYEIHSGDELGEDISSSFNDIFHPDFEDAAFLKASSSKEKIAGRNKSKVVTEFSYDEFFKCIKEDSQISETAFTKKEMKEIERLASLYGVSELVAAHVVINCYSPEKEKGKRVDLNQVNEDLKNEISYSIKSRKSSHKKNTVIGDDGLAAKIKYFEIASPKDVLSVLQNGTKPARADLNIINILSKDYNLPNPVINVAIDFILTMNNNVLSTYSAEKIGASLSRENIETAVDAMEYLRNNYVKENKKSGKKSYKPSTKKVEEVKEEIETPSEEQSEEYFENLLKKFEDR